MVSDPTSVINRCTVQRSDGSFCDARSMPDGPFPICAKHALRLHEHMRHSHLPVIGDGLMHRPQDVPEGIQLLEQQWRERQRVKRQASPEDRSQVYYVRIGDHVKIGYSINMHQRLSALRVNRDAVLATEPGGRDLERQRHAQFAAERVGRREDFNPSRRLLAHIEAVRAKHGEPRITTWQAPE